MDQGTIPEADKRKIYLDPSYVKLIQSKYPDLQGNLSSKFLRNYYWKHYKDNLLKYTWTHQKVYFHPDITIYDFDYLHEKLQRVPTNVLGSETLLMVG